jgi:hypothetical protein
MSDLTAQRGGRALVPVGSASPPVGGVNTGPIGSRMISLPA